MAPIQRALAALLLAPAVALAQAPTGAPPQTYPPQPQTYPPQAYPPQAYPPPAQPAPPPAGTGAAAAPAPGTPAGTGSQQVVVNPPPTQPAPPPVQPAPSTTAVTVNPGTPAAAAYNQPTSPVVVQAETDRRSALEIVAIDAAYGGLAGFLVGGGVALIANGNWGRSLMIGTGAGVLVGAAVGGIHAYNASGANTRSPYADATDGLGSPERDRDAGHRPQTTFALNGRF